MALPTYKDIVELMKKDTTVEAQEQIMALREASLYIQKIIFCSKPGPECTFPDRRLRVVLSLSQHIGRWAWFAGSEAGTGSPPEAVGRRWLDATLAGQNREPEVVPYERARQWRSMYCRCVGMACTASAMTRRRLPSIRGASTSLRRSTSGS